MEYKKIIELCNKALMLRHQQKDIYILIGANDLDLSELQIDKLYEKVNLLEDEISKVETKIRKLTSQ